MFQLTAIAIFFIILIIGLGFLLALLFPALIANHRDWFTPFWLGFASLIGFLQIWHFFLPVNWLVLVLLSILSGFGWVVSLKKKLLPLIPKKIWVWAGIVLVFFLCSNHAIFSQPDYDHGLYHLQTVKWFNQFPIVRGLGNLQHRLAFNSSNYLYAAFLNTSFFHGYSTYVAILIPFIMLVLESLSSLYSWLRNSFTGSKSILFKILILPVLFWQIGNQPFAGYPADMTIFIMQIVLFGKLLLLWQETSDEQNFRALFFQIIILSVTAITIKLSFVIFGFFTIVMVFILGYKRFGRTAFSKSNSFPVFGIFTLWGLPWLIRNAILSGYLLFPSALISVDVPWKMPVFLVRNIQQGITAWARTNSGSLEYSADLQWFFLWLKRFVFEARTAFFLALILFIVLFFLSGQKKFQRIHIKDYLPLLLLVSVSIVVWFVSAPVYRFSGAIIWLFLIIALLMFFEWITINYSSQTAWTTSILLLLFMFFLLPNGLSRDFSFSTLGTVEPEMQIAQRNQPIEKIVVKTTTSGLQVNIPGDGEACWDLPLPCTTPNDFLAQLQLFDAKDMAKGFFIPLENK